MSLLLIFLMNASKTVTLKYSNDALRRLIGPVGALRRKIEDETGAVNSLR